MFTLELFIVNKEISYTLFDVFYLNINLDNNIENNLLMSSDWQNMYRIGFSHVSNISNLTNNPSITGKIKNDFVDINLNFDFFFNDYFFFNKKLKFFSWGIDVSDSYNYLVERYNMPASYVLNRYLKYGLSNYNEYTLYRANPKYTFLLHARQLPYGYYTLDFLDFKLRDIFRFFNYYNSRKTFFNVFSQKHYSILIDRKSCHFSLLEHKPFFFREDFLKGEPMNMSRYPLFYYFKEDRCKNWLTIFQFRKFIDDWKYQTIHDLQYMLFCWTLHKRVYTLDNYIYHNSHYFNFYLFENWFLTGVRDWNFTDHLTISNKLFGRNSGRTWFSPSPMYTLYHSYKTIMHKYINIYRVWIPIKKFVEYPLSWSYEIKVPYYNIKIPYFLNSIFNSSKSDYSYTFTTYLNQNYLMKYDNYLKFLNIKRLISLDMFTYKNLYFNSGFYNWFYSTSVDNIFFYKWDKFYSLSIWSTEAWPFYIEPFSRQLNMNVYDKDLYIRSHTSLSFFSNLKKMFYNTFFYLETKQQYINFYDFFFKNLIIKKFMYDYNSNLKNFFYNLLLVFLIFFLIFLNLFIQLRFIVDWNLKNIIELELKNSIDFYEKNRIKFWKKKFSYINFEIKLIKKKYIWNSYKRFIYILYLFIFYLFFFFYFFLLYLIFFFNKRFQLKEKKKLKFTKVFFKFDFISFIYYTFFFFYFEHKYFKKFVFFKSCYFFLERKDYKNFKLLSFNIQNNNFLNYNFYFFKQDLINLFNQLSFIILFFFFCICFKILFFLRFIFSSFFFNYLYNYYLLYFYDISIVNYILNLKFRPLLFFFKKLDGRYRLFDDFYTLNFIFRILKFFFLKVLRLKFFKNIINYLKLQMEKKAEKKAKKKVKKKVKNLTFFEKLKKKLKNSSNIIYGYNNNFFVQNLNKYLDINAKKDILQFLFKFLNNIETFIFGNIYFLMLYLFRFFELLFNIRFFFLEKKSGDYFNFLMAKRDTALFSFFLMEHFKFIIFFWYQLNKLKFIYYFGNLLNNFSIFELKKDKSTLDMSLWYLFDKLKYNEKFLYFSDFYIGKSFDKFIFKPLKKIFVFIFFNNILVNFVFLKNFLKYLKLEIFIKFIFFYFFSFFYVFYLLLINNENLILNLISIKYLNIFFIFFIRLKFFISFIYEFLFYNFFIYFYFFFKKFNLIFILFIFIFFILNINLLNINILWVNFYFFDIFYLFVFFFEFIKLFFDFYLFQLFLNLWLNIGSSFIFLDDWSQYTLNYHEYIHLWKNLLNEYNVTFNTFSYQKVFGKNKIYTHRDHPYVLLVLKTSGIFHFFMRLKNILYYDASPYFWFFDMYYWNIFYRLGWGLISYYSGGAANHNLLYHFFHGSNLDNIFFRRSVGLTLNNLYFFSTANIIDFFCFTFIWKYVYYFFCIYFFFEFFVYKFIDIFVNILFFFLLKINDLFFYFFKFLFFFSWFFYFLFYFFSYFYYFFYLHIFFENIYILFYSFFIFDIFLNGFLFLYNFFFFYQKTFWDFVNIDINFIQHNFFNYVYKFKEDILNFWPTYGYKTKESIWKLNTYENENFARYLIMNDLKNLYFFKTFFSFFSKINMVSVLFLFLYYFLIFRIFQHIFSFINKWFFFVFFNNDQSIVFFPKYGWETFQLNTPEKKSYYFNEGGLHHILGGYFIENHFYFFNSYLDDFFFQKTQKTHVPNFAKLGSDQYYFFNNQSNTIKTLWKKNFYNPVFSTWYTITLFFFKNYRFTWYPYLDPIIYTYCDVFGSFNRNRLDRLYKHWFPSLSYDRYNYLWLPASGRITYIDYFSRNWTFYVGFFDEKIYKKYINIDLKYLYKFKDQWSRDKEFWKFKNMTKYQNRTITNKMWLYYTLKKPNIKKYFFEELYYPLIMFWLTSFDMQNTKKNLNNYKYIFPLLLPRKEFWINYQNLFLEEKIQVEKRSSVYMSTEWITNFNKTRFLSLITAFTRIPYILHYDDFNYKGVWNLLDNLDRVYLNTYPFFDYTLLKKIDVTFYNLFYKDFIKVTNFEGEFIKWLSFISKRYYNYRLPFFKTNFWLSFPFIVKQNFFMKTRLFKFDAQKEKKFENQNVMYDLNLEESVNYMNHTGAIDYLSDVYWEDPEAPYTQEDWEYILFSYLKGAFHTNEDDVIVMSLVMSYDFINDVGIINQAYGTLFFFIPCYIFCFDNLTYFEQNAAFIFQGEIDRSYTSEIWVAMVHSVGLRYFDFQDDRYFFLHLIEQESIDFLTRIFQEIFYNFTKYINWFDYLESLKKSIFLLNDDLANDEFSSEDYMVDERIYAYLKMDDSSEFFLEEDETASLAFMQEQKISNTFFDLANSTPFIKSYYDDYNLNYLHQNLKLIVEYSMYYKNHYLRFIPYYDIYREFLVKCEDISMFNFVLFFFQKLKNDPNLYFQIHTYYSQFYKYYFSKNRELTFWYDSFFSYKQRYMLGYLRRDDPTRDFLRFRRKRTQGILYDKLPGYYFKRTLVSFTDHLENLKPKKRFTFFEYRYRNNKYKAKLGDHYTRRVWLQSYNMNKLRYKWFRYLQRKPYNYRIINLIKLRKYLVSYIDVYWFWETKYIPVTSAYLRNVHPQFLHFHKPLKLLAWYQKRLTLLNSGNIYIDQTSYLMDQRQHIWQFKMHLSNDFDFIFFPVYEFFIYYFLLCSIIVFIFFILYFFYFYFFFYKEESDNDKKNIYCFYNKKLDMWFDIRETRKKKKNKILLKKK